MLLAPAFELPDHVGRCFRLADHLGAAVTLIFYRGHWCPYCRRYLAKVQANMPRFAEGRVSVAAISPEPPATSNALALDLHLTFPLLSDTDGVVINAFGVRNGFVSTRTLLPHPAVVIVDARGHIAFTRIDRHIEQRTTMRTIFSALDGLAADEPEPS